VPESSFEIHEHAKLLKKNRNCDVAVKRNNFTVLQMKDIAARRVYLFSSGRNCSRRQDKIAFVRPVEGKLDNNDVARNIDAIKLSMHVGKCGGIDIDCDSDIGAIVFFARTYIVEISPVGK
jgi:hypothetical protein